MRIRSSVTALRSRAQSGAGRGYQVTNDWINSLLQPYPPRVDCEDRADKSELIAYLKTLTERELSRWCSDRRTRPPEGPPLVMLRSRRRTA